METAQKYFLDSNDGNDVVRGVVPLIVHLIIMDGGGQERDIHWAHICRDLKEMDTMKREMDNYLESALRELISPKCKYERVIQITGPSITYYEARDGHDITIPVFQDMKSPEELWEMYGDIVLRNHMGIKGGVKEWYEKIGWKED
jgi:hypothetical protein